MNTTTMKNPELSPKEKLTLETLTLEDLDRFSTANAMLDESYGKKGTPTRAAFIKEAYACYYQVIAKAEAEKKKLILEEN